VEYTRTHLANSSSGFENSLLALWGQWSIDVLSWRVDREESVADVRTIVYWKANRNSNIDDGYTIQSDAPEK